MRAYVPVWGHSATVQCQGCVCALSLLCSGADMSFNNIEVIEGLSSLHKLRDLSLAHNRICRLKGMEGLHSLQVLSLGHNCLKDLEQVSYSTTPFLTAGHNSSTPTPSS